MKAIIIVSISAALLILGAGVVSISMSSWIPVGVALVLVGLMGIIVGPLLASYL